MQQGALDPDGRRNRVYGPDTSRRTRATDRRVATFITVLVHQSGLDGDTVVGEVVVSACGGASTPVEFVQELHDPRVLGE